MNKIVYFSEEGLRKIKQDLQQLKTVERPAITAQIAEARDKGDLSENAEYDAAKEAQGMLEMRIAEMEGQIANARVVDESKMDTSKAYILSTVRIMNKKLGKEFRFTLVGDSEADLQAGKISINSPIGKALLGSVVGQVVLAKVPAGDMELEVLEITR
jgi:transcription elongation factor GreA